MIRHLPEPEEFGRPKPPRPDLVRADRAEPARRRPEVKKQISLFLQRRDWHRLRAYAARQKRPITGVIYDWIRPRLAELPDAELPDPPTEGGPPPAVEED